MDNGILEHLYYGEIYPAEDIRPRSKQYLQRQREQGSRYDELLETIKSVEPSLAVHLTETMEKQTDLVSEELAVTFAEGFRLGAKMMIEVLADREMR